MLRDIEEILEFDKVKTLISGYCISNLGVSLVENMKPLKDLEEIQRSLDICGEAKEIRIISGGLPLRGLKDIRKLMEQSEVFGTILEPLELLNIADTVHVIRNLKTFANKLPKDYPIISGIIDSLSPFPKLEESIARCIDMEGNILDSASPLLSKIRRQIVTTREKVISLLQSILHSQQYQTAIQEDIITLRNNRYVIPVKQSLRSNIPGIIQARSTSGVTAFVEPAGAIELNNQLRELADQEIEEIKRILRELTDNVREILPELRLAVDILGELDFIDAKASFCLSLDTSKPILNDRGYINLVKARHPILQKQIADKVVPVDFYIGDGFNTLIITGPNTGGKTVALKTIGLLTLMMQAGLHVPANDGSQMAVFQKIFADIGDEQSIEQNLSTFSSHITRIKNIIEHVDDSSLVLLDELGAGTEPSEGAALGMAILDFLHSHHAKTVATTHHDSLKAHAYTQEGMENASVTFDIKTLSPTFELRIGLPGSSNALRIAERLGIPHEILDTAREYQGAEALGVADLISKVEGMQIDLEKQKRLAEEKNLSASKVQQEHERLLQQMKSRKKEMEREALREAAIIVENARKLVENTISELRAQKQPSPKVIQEARQKIVKARKEIAKAVEPSQPQEIFKEPVPEELKQGEEVYIKSIGGRGILTSYPDEKNSVNIRIGGAKMNVPLSDIMIVPKEHRREETQQKKSSNAVNLRFSKKSDLSSTLHLRGLRVEEALEKTDKYLDDAALAGLDSISIIHGMGTGALREAVTDLLMTHPLVADFRQGNRNEGGLGVTVVELRKD